MGLCGGAGSVPGQVQWVKGSGIAAAAVEVAAVALIQSMAQNFRMPWVQPLKKKKKKKKKKREKERKKEKIKEGRNKERPSSFLKSMKYIEQVEINYHTMVK